MDIVLTRCALGVAGWLAVAGGFQTEWLLSASVNC